MAEARVHYVAAQRISTYAMTLLHNSTGYVHSLFDHSFNVKIHNTLIHIGTCSKGLSCLGMQLDDTTIVQLTQSMHQNDMVVVHDRLLRIYTHTGTYCISFAQAAQVDCNIYGMNGGLSKDRIRSQVEDILSSYKLGKRVGLIVDQTLQGIVRKLQVHQYDKQLFTYLIGRGLGLTPSGDDLLVGFSFGLALQHRLSTFGELLCMYLPGKTNEISQAYLLAVALGNVNEPYIQLANALDQMDQNHIQTALDDILATGHTSGADALLGFATSIGLQVLPA